MILVYTSSAVTAYLRSSVIKTATTLLLLALSPSIIHGFSYLRNMHPLTLHLHPYTLFSTLSPPSHSNNLIKRLRDKITRQPKRQQPTSNAPKPRQAAFILLPRHPHVHSPQSGNDVHRQNNRSQNSQLAQHVGGLLLSLVHADVDLCEVVAMGSSKDSVSH